MEKNLAKLKETWTSINFVFTQMKDSEVSTIKLSEDDFELLEENQMMVQGMGASRFVATFESEINSWQANLGNVNSVCVQMGEIQRTWSFLESLFLHSDEVKKELPEQSKSFVGIDSKVRNFL
jgi:dynein heavy chain